LRITHEFPARDFTAHQNRSMCAEQWAEWGLGF
jgi:hypothetical protein